MRSESSRSGSRIPANTAVLLAASLVSAAVTLVTTPFLFTMLGASQFGLWVLLLGVVAIASLADLGFGSAQVREVARAASTGDDRRAQGALALGLLFYAALGLVLFACVAAGWGVFATVFDLGEIAPQGRKTAFLLVAAFAVDALAMPWRSALEGSQKMLPLAATTAASALLGGALGLALVAFGAGLVGLGWAAVAASVLRVAMLVGAARRWVPDMRPKLRALRRDEVRGVLGYGARVQATKAASAVNSDTDRLVLGAFSSAAIVAPFDVGAKLAGLMRLVPWHALTAFFPVAAALHAEGQRAHLDRLYLRATRYLAAFACMSAAALVASAGPLVELWMGRPLPLAATTIVLLAPAYAVHLTSGAAAAVTRAEGAPGRETRYTLFAAGLNAALTIPLLLTFGTWGVPLATAVALVLGTTYFFWHFHRASERPLAPLARAVWKPFAAAALAVALTWTVADLMPDASGRIEAALAASSCAGLALLLTTVVLVVLRFFEADDRALFRRLVRRTRVAVSHPALASIEGGHP